jgi:ParB-like chromosome segregation protein Spo0J
VSSQLTLLPSTAPELRRESLSVDAIDGFDNAAPSAKLRELIRDLGLLRPVVVVPARPGRYRVIEGRRRCKAIAQLAAAGEWPTPPHVYALVLCGRQTTRREVRGGLTLALHASRSASPASELRAIESILQADRSADEVIAVKEIAAQTGISVQTVRRRLRIRSLTAGLRAAFEEGRITAGVAEKAARLSDQQQARLEQHLEQAGRLTLAHVRDAARAQASAASALLPDELFTDHHVPWQTSVRGHLTAALDAVPKEDHAALLEGIAGVLASLEDEVA